MTPWVKDRDQLKGIFEMASVLILQPLPLDGETAAEMLRKHGFDVLGFCQEPLEAAALLKQNPPNVLVTDILLPEIDVGAAFISATRSEFPKTKIVVLCKRVSTAFAAMAKRSGAHGFVSLQDPSVRAVEAIQCAVDGKDQPSWSLFHRVSP